jgi:hypothetical protein
MNGAPMQAQIEQAHARYCELTGQKMSLRFDRQRQWYELLRAGFTVRDVETVVRYLQREIREGRRNVGALKLSNLLQPDRFEEDLQIRGVRLRAPSASAPANRCVFQEPTTQEREQMRAEWSRMRQQLGLPRQTSPTPSSPSDALTPASPGPGRRTP